MQCNLLYIHERLPLKLHCCAYRIPIAKCRSKQVRTSVSNIGRKRNIVSLSLVNISHENMDNIAVPLLRLNWC